MQIPLEKKRRQFLDWVRTDTFVFIFFPRLLKCVPSRFFECVFEFSLRALIIIRLKVIFLYFLVWVSFWYWRPFFRWDLVCLEFLWKNSVKVKIVCTGILLLRSWCYRGHYFNLGSCYRFISHTDKRLSPKSYFVVRPSFLLFSYSGLQKKASGWKCAF